MSILSDLLKLKEMAKKSHYQGDDQARPCATEWFDNPGECNCGADEHNNEVDALYIKITKAIEIFNKQSFSNIEDRSDQITFDDEWNDD